MKLSKSIITHQIKILEPRWHDRVVLVAKHKVGTHNILKFKAKQYPDEYYLSAETCRKYPLDSNGVIPCYAVSLDELVVYEGRE